MPTRATNGHATPMPSVKLDLGRYVTVRPRKDGTARVLFEVPARLRPSGWSPAIPLPITGERRGDLRDADEIGRIQSDADMLLNRLRAARMGRDVEGNHHPHSIPVLIRSWQSSPAFTNIKPRTQKGYAYHAGLIERWSKVNGHRPAGTITVQAIEAFLKMYDNRPTTRRHVKIVLGMLMKRAKQLKWRADNPLSDMIVGAPESRVTIWEQEDVDRYMAASRWARQPGLAALILTLWETGQRLTDARLARRGAEYIDGVFRFHQSKTGSYVTVPISLKLQTVLEEIKEPDSPYLFIDTANGRPFDEQRLGHLFASLQAKCGGRKLVLRALRHSCVVQLARSGSGVPEIASITGHAPSSAGVILAKYLPRDSVLAAQAQRRRGLTGKKAATKV